MSLPRVSIALCTCNGACYLPEQLESLLQQTRLADEIIISDDGSTDATLELLEAFKTSYPGDVRILKNTTALGYGENFKKAILQCTGDYIFPCDQDDVWYPNKIEIFLQAWEKQPTAKGWFCNADITNPGDSQSSLSIWDVVYGSDNLPAETSLQQYFPMLLLNHSFILGATMAITLDAAKRAFSYPWLPSLPFHDYHLALHLSIDQGLHPIPQRLQLWRQHAGQQTGAAGYVAKKEKVQLARKAWIQQWQPETEGIEMCRYWAFGLAQMEKKQEYWHIVYDKGFAEALQMVASQLSEAKQRYFASIPWALRKKKLLKHVLKGGEYLRVTAAELWYL